MSISFTDPKIRSYSERMSTSIDGALYHIAKDTFWASVKPFDASDHIQGRLLSMLSWILRPKVIVELGAFTGYGTYCLAEGLISGGKIITVEQDTLKLELLKKNVAYINAQVEIINDTAINAISGIEEHVDLLFIDAAKKEYTLYYDHMMPKMSPGGLIIVDNVLWKGEVVKPNRGSIATALHEFNKMIAADRRVEALLLPYRDGLTIVRVK